MRYWLIKSEPGEFGISDLKRDKVACWDEVRDYQARNMLRDDMKKAIWPSFIIPTVARSASSIS
ncbi:MAG: EVE domain-containing protein [Pseudomonadota bacterium]|nr:EVE domain-containing protein [Pseudomonadota bacterium]